MDPNVQARMEELKKALTEHESESIHSMQKEAEKEVNYLDLKKDLKEISAEIDSLTKTLDKELAFAKENGMTEKAAEKLATLSSEIARKSKESIEISYKVKEVEESIKSSIKDTVVDAKIKAGDLLKQATTNLVDKAVAGAATIEAVVDKVKDANERAVKAVGAIKDTIYTNIEEPIHQIHRNYLSFNYNKDKAIANVIDKTKDFLEKQFQKSASIKEAFKDLGRALMGKERQNDKGEYTNTEKAIVEKLREVSDGLKKEMGDLEKQYNVSKEVSLQNIKSAQELREGAGLKKSNSLQERFDKAKEKSIDSKRDSAEKTAEKSAEKTTDKDSAEKEQSM